MMSRDIFLEKLLGEVERGDQSGKQSYYSDSPGGPAEIPASAENVQLNLPRQRMAKFEFPFNDDDEEYTSDEEDGEKYASHSLLVRLAWIIYAILPILAIIVFLMTYYSSFVLNLFSFSDRPSNRYYPDFPSGYKSESGSYDDYNIEFFDLQQAASSSPDGWNHEERVLFCVPLRDAAPHLSMFFGHMRNLTYPHNLIDLAFLISDTSDSTIKDLKRELKNIQSDKDPRMHFGRINIYEKDFGQIIGQSFSDRHGFQAQGPRRKLMAIARNWLLVTALRPDHSWVYWRDADVETVPPTIIEDLMHHDKDVIVPNIWRPLPDWLGYEQPYDLNSWQESEGGIELADKLDEDAVIVEGYPEYATWRTHLAYLRDPYGDPEVEMELDGIGGVSILSKAHVFRSGAMFPAFSYLKHAETEGFGKLCRTMNFSVIGLPHYTIWHIYEPSSDDIQHMKWMAEEETNRLEKAKIQKLYDKIWMKAFEEVNSEWNGLKFNVFKNTDVRRDVSIDWSEVDEYLQDFDEEGLEEADANTNKDFGVEDMSKDVESALLEKLKSKKLRQEEENHQEELFGHFPLNPYVSGKNGKNYRFVKFKKTNDLDIINSNVNDELKHKQEQEMKEDLINELREERMHQQQDKQEPQKISEGQETKAGEDTKDSEGLYKNKIAENHQEIHVLEELYKDSEKQQKDDELHRLRALAEAKKARKLARMKAAEEEKNRRNQIAVQREMERRRKMGLVQE
ncbi:hypothetical protein KL911_003738 [Ogataea haglerorum]|uniref:uncharacterized protein n=1 Tax=Ogataea haglerorum TaxID=1937702 RepID=UPI001C8A4AE3|nr:uncharacterized protein KL911_003738 [Ogataea haglerorum]KAG7752456.1 hypothetical protein KL911_003738 [Ogataea haglerorum]